MGASTEPLGDLSVSVEPSDASVAAFLFSKSIPRLCLLLSEKPSKTSAEFRAEQGCQTAAKWASRQVGWAYDRDDSLARIMLGHLTRYNLSPQSLFLAEVQS